jgi:hypothetical protein
MSSEIRILKVKKMSNSMMGNGSTIIATSMRMPRGSTIPPRADCNVRNCGGIVTKLIAISPLFTFLVWHYRSNKTDFQFEKRSKYRANNRKNTSKAVF